MTNSPLANLVRSLEQAGSSVFSPGGPRRSQALVASSSPVSNPEQATPRANMLEPLALQARKTRWQSRVLEMATRVPEVGGAAALVRGTADRVRIVASGGNAATRGDLQWRLDGMDLGRAVELLWLTGEFYLGWPDHLAPYSLSIDEMNTRADPKQVRGPSGWMDMPDNFIRIWKPSLKNRWYATSPNESALDLIEAMYLHQVADTAVATSRLAGAGILFWPTTLPSQPLRDDGTPERGSREEMLQHFHQASMQSIENRKSADATIPFVFFYDPSDGDSFKPELLRIDKDDLAAEYKERFETYRMRYAAAVELPIEIQTGMGQTNHWSAWAIRDDKFHYLSPMIDLIVHEMQKRIVDPINELNGGTPITLEVDAEMLIKKPDVTETVMQMLSLQLIDPAYAFGLLGLDATKALEYTKKDYASSVLPSTPSDFKVGGDRGGGAFRERP